MCIHCGIRGIRGSADSGRLASSVPAHDARDREWHNVFLELVRQVYVHCNERGALLDTVRVHLESQLSEARARLAANPELRDADGLWTPLSAT